MERIGVLVHGFCGALAGFAGYLFLLVAACQAEWIPKSIASEYLFLIVLPIIFAIIGFWLAVRKDWWIMKRRW